VGPGAKTGGPDYVASLGTSTATFDGDPDAWRSEAARALRSADPSGLRAESDVLRWCPLRSVLLFVGNGVPEGDVAHALATASALGVDVDVVDREAALAARLDQIQADKARLLGEVPDHLLLACHDAGLWVDTTPVAGHPRLEARRWAREQAVSETRHRYGNVTARRPGLLD
jgi:RHH-type proline utilization regulon transcriptional repressor/proline dehydrogenase/delta 1-pyrroline-5-carboxylate dehydrogenase